MQVYRIKNGVFYKVYFEAMKLSRIVIKVINCWCHCSGLNSLQYIFGRLFQLHCTFMMQLKTLQKESQLADGRKSLGSHF